MTEIKLPTFRCERCGHTWYPRQPEEPLRCAKCKSPYWRTAKPTRPATGQEE